MGTGKVPLFYREVCYLFGNISGNYTELDPLLKAAKFENLTEDVSTL